MRWCVQFITFPPAIWRRSPAYRLGYAASTLLWTWIVAVFTAALMR